MGVGDVKKKRKKAQTQTHTHTQTDRHCDLETELVQWADSVKSRKIRTTIRTKTTGPHGSLL